MSDPVFGVFFSAEEAPAVADDAARAERALLLKGEEVPDWLRRLRTTASRVTGAVNSGTRGQPLVALVAVVDGERRDLDDDELLTYREASRRLDVSERTVRRLVEARTLEVIDVSPGSPRIARSEIDRHRRGTR